MDGLPATTVARTVVDLARHAALSDALVAADAALHRGLTSHSALLRMLDSGAAWPEAHRARTVVELASGRAASALESRARFTLVHELDLPPPQLNPWLTDDMGTPHVQAPLLWPAWRIVAAPAEAAPWYDVAAPRETPFARTLRARRIRALGYRVVPFTWWDLIHQAARLAHRIRVEGRHQTADHC